MIGDRPPTHSRGESYWTNEWILGIFGHTTITYLLGITNIHKVNVGSWVASSGTEINVDLMDKQMVSVHPLEQF